MFWRQSSSALHRRTMVLGGWEINEAVSLSGLEQMMPPPAPPKLSELSIHEKNPKGTTWLRTKVATINYTCLVGRNKRHPCPVKVPTRCKTQQNSDPFSSVQNRGGTRHAQKTKTTAGGNPFLLFYFMYLEGHAVHSLLSPRDNLLKYARASPPPPLLSRHKPRF